MKTTDEINEPVDLLAALEASIDAWRNDRSEREVKVDGPSNDPVIAEEED